MRLVVSVVCLLLSAALVPVSASDDDVDAANRAFLVTFFDDLLAEADPTAAVDWNEPEAAAFLSQAGAGVGGLDIAALFGHAGGGGAPEEGGFPLVGDAILLESAIRINVEIKCSDEPRHYHTAVQDENLTFDNAGIAVSSFSIEGPVSVGLAVQLPAGTWIGEPTGVPEAKGFFYEDVVLYGGDSDFACIDFKYCAFGICYYFVWNTPKIIGFAETAACNVLCPNI